MFNSSRQVSQSHLPVETIFEVLSWAPALGIFSPHVLTGDVAIFLLLAVPANIYALCHTCSLSVSLCRVMVWSSRGISWRSRGTWLTLSAHRSCGFQPPERIVEFRLVCLGKLDTWAALSAEGELGLPPPELQTFTENVCFGVHVCKVIIYIW